MSQNMSRNMSTSITCISALALLIITTLAPVLAREENSDHTAGISIAEAIATALLKAPQVGVIEAERQSARALLSAPSGILADNPSLAVQSSGGRFLGKTGAYSINADIVQSFRMPGQGEKLSLAATATADGGEKKSTAALFAIAHAAAQGYYALAALDEKIAIAERLLVLAQTTQAGMRKRAEVGEVSSAAETLFRLDVITTENELSRLQREREQMAQGFAATTGISKEVLDTLAPPPQPPEDFDIAKLQTASVAQHPRLLWLRQQQSARGADLNYQRSLRLPPISLGVGANFSQGVYDNGSGGGSARSASETLGLVELFLPIPFFFRNQSVIASAETSVTIAAREVLLQEQQLEAQRLQATAAIVSLRGITARMRDLLPIVDSVAGSFTKAMQLGEMDLIAALTARERLLKLKYDLVDQQRELAFAFLNAEAAIGEYPGSLIAKQPFVKAVLGENP